MPQQPTTRSAPRGVFHRALLGLCLACACACAAPAKAGETKSWFYDWTSRHWTYLDFQPYIEDYNTTTRAMNPVKPWVYPPNQTTPRELVNTYRAAQLMNKFYVDEDTGAAVMEVGSNFYRLSQTEKQRFVTTIDRLYMVTNSNRQILLLKDWNSKRSVGQFTRHGLMLF